MNRFQSIVYSPLFWIPSFHLCGSLLITLKWNSAGFKFKQFFTDVFTWFSWEYLLSFWAFCRENEKDWNHLMQCLLNIANGEEQTSLNLIYFPSCFLLNVALCYLGEAQCFSYWKGWGIFLQDFHANTTAVASLNLHWLCDCGLKTQNQ